MASRGKMMVKLASKKARQQQVDQTLAVKADKKVQKKNVPGLDCVTVNMPSVAETDLSTITTMWTNMPALTNQDPEIDMDETPATPAAYQGPENYDNGHITVAETVTVSASSSSDESRPVKSVVIIDDVTTNMPTITNQVPEIDMDNEDPESATPAAEDDQGPENDDDGHGDEEMNEVPQQQPAVSRPKKRRRIEEQKAHNKDNYTLLDGCKETCRQKCQTKFTNEQRIHINESYWDLSFSERRLWLDSHIRVTPVTKQDKYTRSNSLVYSLPLATSKETVCKFMFLKTLGLKTDGMISEFVKRKQTGDLGTLIKDNRGKAAPKNKLDKDLIREHICPITPRLATISFRIPLTSGTLNPI